MIVRTPSQVAHSQREYNWILIVTIINRYLWNLLPLCFNTVDYVNGARLYIPMKNIKYIIHQFPCIFYPEWKLLKTIMSTCMKMFLDNIEMLSWRRYHFCVIICGNYLHVGVYLNTNCEKVQTNGIIIVFVRLTR